MPHIPHVSLQSLFDHSDQLQSELDVVACVGTCVESCDVMLVVGAFVPVVTGASVLEAVSGQGCTSGQFVDGSHEVRQ